MKLTDLDKPKTKMNARRHFFRDKMRGRRVFGLYKYIPLLGKEYMLQKSPSPTRSVLLVPELRKRRSERDPVLLEEQLKNLKVRGN